MDLESASLFLDILRYWRKYIRLAVCGYFHLPILIACKLFDKAKI
jgi:hypothetical protein